MRRITVHMVGNAHLDPVWLWRWTEGQAEALATSRSAVDRLAEYPDFQFVRGESQIYQWIEQEDPVLFAEIQTLIRQGRWHVVNGMVIQPDMNLPHGESFVRQVLLAKAYLSGRLGVEPRVAYCVDSFGHAGTLPQILKKCGFDFYVFMRPMPHEKALPAETFWWEGPDGSRLLTCRITGLYLTRTTAHDAVITNAVAAMPPQLSHTMCFFGLGNHGGGPTKAQIENIQQIARARPEIDIRFSSPATYFAAIAADAPALPVVADELQMHAVGCYSVVSALKRAHRQAESALLVAERLAVLAELSVAHPLEAAGLRALWQDLCFNQFHDIIAGTSIKQATDEAIMAFGRITLGAGEIANAAGRAIAARIDTRGAGGTVVVFNPRGEPSSEYVEYEPWTEWQPWDVGRWGLLDEDGQPVPYQAVETHEALSGPTTGLTRLVFRPDVPALGYRLFRFAPSAPQATPPRAVRATATALDNEHLAVRFDPATGAIASCRDRARGLELVGARGWNVAQVLEDYSDTWSHGVRGFAAVIGAFGQATMRVVDQGPLQASVLVERRYEGSTWLQQIVLRAGEYTLLVRNWLLWQGHFRMVKLAFDVATPAPDATHDVPFGWCQRACNGDEVPTQMWVDVSGPVADDPAQQGGLAVLNDGKYGCDVTESLLRVTILRSPPYAYHPPHPIGAKQRYDWVDQGAQEFTLVLRPHVGDWRDTDIVPRARALNQPLLPITAYGHAGERPGHGSLATLSSLEMEVTALKRADTGEGYIVRVADRHGRGGQGELRWFGQRVPLALAPFEVTTLRLVPRDGSWQIEPCDMIERALT